MKKLFFTIFGLFLLVASYSQGKYAQQDQSQAYQLLADTKYKDQSLPKSKVLFTKEKPSNLRPVNLEDDDEGCQFSNCSQLIAYWSAYYQEIADELCQEIVASVSCCSGGFPAYALLFIVPNCNDTSRQ